MIRLDPKHPPPAVDFDEWDGLVKMIFNRKNKKVTSIFRTKTALQQLYDRYCSYAKMEGKTEPNMPVERFKEVLELVLKDPLFDRRGRSLNLDDISQMLHLFQAHGIHFI